MKKICILFALLFSVLVIQAQNSVIKGVCIAVTINGSKTAATSGEVTLPVSIQSEWDWSLQVIAAKGAVLTPDSVYATFKLYVSNSDGVAVWSEPDVVVRDTMTQATIAASLGKIISGTDFQGIRMKLHINRPASLDTLKYTVYYVYKLPVAIGKVK